MATQFTNQSDQWVNTTTQWHPAEITVSLDLLTSTASVKDITLAFGTATIPVDLLTVSLSAKDLTIGISGIATIPVDLLASTLSAKDITLAFGTAIIPLDLLIGTLSAKDITLDITGTASISLDLLTGTLSAKDITLAFGTATIPLDLLTSTLSAKDIIIDISGTATIVLDLLAGVFSTKDITLAFGTASISLDLLTSNVNAKHLRITYEVSLDKLSISLSPNDVVFFGSEFSLIILDKIVGNFFVKDTTFTVGGPIRRLDALSLAFRLKKIKTEDLPDSPWVAENRRSRPWSLIKNEAWDDDKDVGEWAFTEQGNKFGYINNSRWSSDPEAIEFCELIGLPMGNAKKHKPCGHWHRADPKFIRERIYPGEFGTVIDTFEYEGTFSQRNIVIHVGNEYYAVFYTDQSNNVVLKTFTIDETGNISNAIVDSWIVESYNCFSCSILELSTGIFLLYYTCGSPSSQAKILTVAISPLDGTITKVAIDSVQWGSNPTVAGWHGIVNVTESVYVAVYQDGGFTYDGRVILFDISAVGVINHTAIDSYIFNTIYNTTHYSTIIKVTSGVFCVIYKVGATTVVRATTLIINASSIQAQPDTYTIVSTFSINIDSIIGVSCYEAGFNGILISYSKATSPFDSYLTTLEVNGLGNIIYKDSVVKEYTTNCAFLKYLPNGEKYLYGAGNGIHWFEVSVDGIIGNDYDYFPITIGGSPSIVRIGETNIYCVGHRYTGVGEVSDGWLFVFNMDFTASYLVVTDEVYPTDDEPMVWPMN